MSIPIQTKVTNKYNTNDSSKQIDGRMTKTGREKREEWGGQREKGGINWLLLYCYIAWHKSIPTCNNIS